MSLNHCSKISGCSVLPTTLVIRLCSRVCAPEVIIKMRMNASVFLYVWTIYKLGIRRGYPGRRIELPIPTALTSFIYNSISTTSRDTVLLCHRRRGALTIPQSVPWRSCPRRAAALGYRHAGCLQLSHVWTADPSADGHRSAASRTAIGGGGHIVSPPPGRWLVIVTRK